MQMSSKYTNCIINLLYQLRRIATYLLTSQGIQQYEAKDYISKRTIKAIDENESLSAFIWITALLLFTISRKNFHKSSARINLAEGNNFVSAKYYFSARRKYNI